MQALLLVSLLIATAFAAVPTLLSNVTAFTDSGFDTIVLDYPSWVTSIQPSYFTDEFFVYGNKQLRTIHSGRELSQFYAEPIYLEFFNDLLDSHVFFFNQSGTILRFTTGISDFDPNSDQYKGIAGPYLPLYTQSYNPATRAGYEKLQDDTADDEFAGYMMYSLRTDYLASLNGIYTTYYAGFFTNASVVNFCVIRTLFNFNTEGGIVTNNYVFDPSKDVFPLYYNNYTAFNQNYKPFVHIVYSGPQNKTFVIVVDPSSKLVFGIDPTGVVPTTNVSLNVDGTQFLDIVSAEYNWQSQLLVVGMSNTGFQAGALVLFDFSKAAPMTIPTPAGVDLLANYSNPKAIAVDVDAIYVGFNGYMEVACYNLTTQKFTYQRLPLYLTRSWAATVTHHHVYFVSNEQNSKVYRVDKRDFCPATCPFFGYCKGGQCTCETGFELDKHKNVCNLIAAEKETIYIHRYHAAHGGEITLGILWALTLIAAAGGWYLWWKSRRGQYQAV